ncbi:amidohydrolase [Rhodobacter capsulatus]|jgi:predicted amidohydrolase YtcJ|uniref:Amidohydrolase family protein n=2 Tax=Rhodobacter capsulatus TaxID=1061 RepID=D5AKS7_RHOCB|nr:amidohydrolase [Rhodobacter capsulatus]ADE85917.1 amidohydrolase family protein [Rhodobacter capsulatus SB 1003]ETD01023.1 hydrolase [Rhodobacter capsulatus DE442]ETD76075.1 hydrolase [Rhodobacter capsulatus R121]ETE53240.1 hydrolase [Rhodobacter capsulatus Y262]MDS0927756.1 amidohydrolase [Rhodobacter capsulatus]
MKAPFMPTADLIVTNARILTMDDARPTAEAIALSGETILALGAAPEILALAGPATRVIDAAGRTVLPGFFEGHVHLGLGGAELAHLHIDHLHGAEEIAQAFRAFAATHPERPILIAQGADYGMLGHPISRHDLDAMISDRPIAMMSHDHHTVWANTAALEATGLMQGAPMPHGHEVVLDEDGLATGELREFEAFGPIIALAGEARINLGIATGEEPATPPTAEERAADKAMILAGMRHCARHGVTSLVNMDGNRYTLELLSEMQAEGTLLLRVKVPFHFKPHMDLSALDRASDMMRDFDDAWISSGFVKMFMDGVVDSRTAYMLNDYADAPGHRSEPLFAPETFKAIATEIDRRGLQIAVHAIGDGAVRVTIDGIEAARAANGPRDARHRIEHIELIDPADIPRLGALGITASLQPPHSPGAMEFPLEPTLTRIGRARWPDAYLWKTLATRGGAPIAYSSDWPVTDVSVLRGIHAGVTRTPFEGCTDECLSLMETLRAYTAGGARAAHRDHVTGTLRPGLAADLVMLGGDIESCAPDAIPDLGIALTVCGGRILWEDPARMP